MCFFESLNGLLLKHVHGTQGIGLQFATLQAFPLPAVTPIVKSTSKESTSSSKLSIWLCKQETSTLQSVACTDMIPLLASYAPAACPAHQLSSCKQ